MPTAKELDLFMQADGGSGNAREDHLVARNLQHILDMPEQQVLSFIKTRDRNTVHKLRMVLQDMPSTDWASVAGSRVGSQAASAASAASRRSKSVSGASMGTRSRRQQQQLSASQERIDHLSAYSTSYGNFFGGPAPVGGGIHDSTAKAFEGVVRKGYQSDFDHWREAAPESKVRVLADACRSLRYFSSSGMPATTYNGQFPKMENHKHQVPKPRDNARNISAVPLGSIYSQSEAEAVIAEARKAQHEGHIKEAQRQIDMNRTLSKAEMRDKPNMTITMYHDPPDVSITECFEINPVHPGNSRSAAKASWHGDVHSKVQVKRHAHSAIKPGERAWLESSADAIFQLRDPTLVAGPPSPSKLVTSKLRGVGKAISASSPTL